jgi:hypothetical protein
MKPEEKNHVRLAINSGQNLVIFVISILLTLGILFNKEHNLSSKRLRHSCCNFSEFFLRVRFITTPRLTKF